MKAHRRTFAAVVLVMGLASAVRVAGADDRFKGPEEDGTKPALTKIAGEGMVNSHAFEFLTELSDKVGARVTGTPQGQKAIDWGVAKMRSSGSRTCTRRNGNCGAAGRAAPPKQRFFRQYVTNYTSTPWAGPAPLRPAAPRASSSP